jgi:glutamyl-Q tRNA(Asp) synthetase
MAESSQPILRFAPSPNGFLHPGHAFSALFAADIAERLGGNLLLRIEDIDLERCRPEFTEAMLEDLDWLGIRFEGEVRVQSQHFGEYRAAAQRLGDLLFPCFCSRAEIAAAAHGTDPDGAPLYPGTCRRLPARERERRIASGDAHAWRIDMARAVAEAGVLHWTELDPETLAPQRLKADPMAWGDAVIVRKDTPTSYHLSVVSDDALQGITHVTRGRDLRAATSIHRLLQRLLSLGEPLYCHHRLILDAERRKLAKSRGSLSLRDLRRAGLSAAELRTSLGFRAH